MIIHTEREIIIIASKKTSKRRRRRKATIIIIYAGGGLNECWMPCTLVCAPPHGNITPTRAVARTSQTTLRDQCHPWLAMQPSLAQKRPRLSRRMATAKAVATMDPASLKPEKYESVDTPTPPPEGKNTVVSSNNGSSGNGQTQNGEMKIKKKKKQGGKIRIKLNLPDKDSTYYTLLDYLLASTQLTLRSADALNHHHQRF